jgi:hypothetical protein
VSQTSSRVRIAVGTLAGFALLGAGAGVLWNLLAPSGTVIAQPGYLFAVGDPELLAGQDGVYALLTGALGLGTGFWVALSSPALPLLRPISAVLGSLLGSVVAWQVGRLLGPDTPHVTRTGAATPVPAPLDLHAIGLLGVWPVLTATVAFVVLLAASLLGRPGDRSASL